MTCRRGSGHVGGSHLPSRELSEGGWRTRIACCTAPLHHPAARSVHQASRQAGQHWVAALVTPMAQQLGLRQRTSTAGAPLIAGVARQAPLRCAVRSRLSVRAEAVKEKPKVCRNGLRWMERIDHAHPRQQSSQAAAAAAPACRRCKAHAAATLQGPALDEAPRFEHCPCRSSRRSRKGRRSRTHPTSLRAGPAPARGGRRPGQLMGVGMGCEQDADACACGFVQIPMLESCGVAELPPRQAAQLRRSCVLESCTPSWQLSRPFLPRLVCHS